MAHIIKNYLDLATDNLRKDALDIVESAYRSIDTTKAIEKAITVKDNVLHINGKSYDLDEFENIYVIGFGKVSCQAAFTLEKLLMNFIDEGVVIGIKDVTCEIIDTYKGTHPMPSDINFKATKEIYDLGERAGENDLVLVLVSGGGSALLCSSQKECDQGQELYKAYLKSGGNIEELNIVRKHISDLKGGGLAKVLYPATVCGIIFSDVPGDNYSAVASGPTFKDDSTIADAQTIIQKYELGDFELTETPKEDKYFEKVENLVLISNKIALDAMKEKANELGYKVNILTDELYEMPDKVCEMMQAEAKEGEATMAGGETRLIVTVTGSGTGGRSDFLAMEMIDKIKDHQVFVAFASDGRDNSDGAGAIVDSATAAKAKAAELDINDYKSRFDSFTFFQNIGDEIITGPLESNVSDLMLLIQKNGK